MAHCLLPKIFGVDVSPSVTLVKSSEQFWHKTRQIWRICEPWEEFVSPKGGALEDWDHYMFLGNCSPTPPLANILPLGRSKG